MNKPETMEELADGLCMYCPLPTESQGVHCYGGPVTMCEGSHCKEAYESYLEEFEEEETCKHLEKIKTYFGIIELCSLRTELGEKFDCKNCEQKEGNINE